MYLDSGEMKGGYCDGATCSPADPDHSPTPPALKPSFYFVEKQIKWLMFFRREETTRCFV